MACTLVTYSAVAISAGIGPKGLPVKSMSRPATITRTPLSASCRQTSTSPWSKNCASSMPTTSTSEVISRIFCAESTGVERIALASCETTSSSEYRTSMRGLKISTRRRANSARFRRRISSSVLPENIEPHITSIQPFWLAFSKNILLLLCFVSLFRASAGRYSSTRVIRAPRALRRPSMSL